MIDKRLKYKAGQRVKKSSTGKRPGYRGDDWGASAEADGYGANTGNNSGPTGNPNNQKDDISVTKDYRGPAELGVTTRDVNPVDMGDADFTAVGPRSKYASNKFRQGMLNSIKEVQTNPKYGGGGFFDSGLGKFIKNIVKTAAFAYAPPMVGKINTGLQVAKVAKNFLDTTGLSEKIGLQDVNVKDAFSNIGKGSTKTGPEDAPREGGDGDNQQNALMAEYLLLLQKMEQGVLQKEEQARFNSLKSRLGKAQGGIMDVNMNRGQLGGMNG